MCCFAEAWDEAKHAEALPKPIVSVGHRPIIWHVMMHAHFGQKDFILCRLQIRGDQRNPPPHKRGDLNDFVMSEGGKNLQLLGTDIQD